MDKIAVSSLVVSIVGAVAAVVAAIYAKGNPTKDDLQRVEKNTAESATHINSVRDHIEAVANCLSEQSKRDSLTARAERVSISVSGQSRVADVMKLRFVVMDSDVTMVRVQFLNKQGMLSGGAECLADGPRSFVVHLDPDIARRWFASGDAFKGMNQKQVIMRTFLLIDGHEAERKFSAEISQISQPDGNKPSVWVQVLVLHGRC